MTAIPVSKPRRSISYGLFALACALLPIKFSFLPVNVGVFDLLILASFVAGVAEGRIISISRNSKSIFYMLGGALALFSVGYILSSVVASSNFIDAISIVLQYAFILLIFLLLGMMNRQEFSGLMKYYVVGYLVLMVSVAAIYFDRSGLVANVLGVPFRPGDRTGSFIGNPNGLAKYIAINLPIIILLMNTGMIRLPYAVIIMAFSLLALLIASSFSGILTILALGLIVLLLNRIDFKVIGSLVLASATVFALFQFNLLPEIFTKRVVEVVMEGDYSEAGSAEQRIELVRAAWDSIGRDPIIGVGAEGSRAFNITDTPPHNVYLMIWAEGGILSFLGWLLFLMSFLLLAIIKYFSSTGPQRFRVTLLMSVFLAFAVAAITNNHMYGRHLMTPLVISFWLLEHLNWLGNRRKVLAESKVLGLEKA